MKLFIVYEFLPSRTPESDNGSPWQRLEKLCRKPGHRVWSALAYDLRITLNLSLILWYAMAYSTLYYTPRIHRPGDLVAFSGMLVYVCSRMLEGKFERQSLFWTGFGTGFCCLKW